jgi:hypothetical protein
MLKYNNTFDKLNQTETIIIIIIIVIIIIQNCLFNDTVGIETMYHRW